MMVKDPVCGAEVDKERVDKGDTRVFAGAPQTDPSYGTKRFHDGKWYYFCGMACRQKFMASPEQYLAKAKEQKV